MKFIRSSKNNILPLAGFVCEAYCAIGLAQLENGEHTNSLISRKKQQHIQTDISERLRGCCRLKVFPFARQGVHIYSVAIDCTARVSYDMALWKIRLKTDFRNGFQTYFTILSADIHR